MLHRCSCVDGYKEKDELLVHSNTGEPDVHAVLWVGAGVVVARWSALPSFLQAAQPWFLLQEKPVMTNK